jgi:subtilase family serine protease
VYSKTPITKGGTSMFTPLVAAIFTRINDEHLAAGKSPIGFVNPTLYANPQMFNDITVGDQQLGSCSANFFSCVEVRLVLILQSCSPWRSGKLGMSQKLLLAPETAHQLCWLSLTHTNSPAFLLC